MRKDNPPLETRSLLDRTVDKTAEVKALRTFHCDAKSLSEAFHEPYNKTMEVWRENMRKELLLDEAIPGAQEINSNIKDSIDVAKDQSSRMTNQLGEILREKNVTSQSRLNKSLPLIKGKLTARAMEASKSAKESQGL